MVFTVPKTVVKFDSKLLERRVDKGRIAALRQAGAFIRSDAKRSMRRRKSGPSPEGKPPRVVGGQLKKLLFYAYDTRTDTVVVGPVGFGRRQVPRTLEMGGDVVRRRSRGKGGKRTIRSRIGARPYMRPALDKNAPNMPRLIAQGARVGG